MNSNGRDARLDVPVLPRTYDRSSAEETTRLAQRVEALSTILVRRERLARSIVARSENLAGHPAYLAKSLAEDIRESGPDPDKALETLHELRRYLQFVAEDLAESQNAVESLRRSWSWKVTAPLRALTHGARMFLGPLRSRRRGPVLQRNRIAGLRQWFRFRKDLQACGLFDEHYYLRSNPDVSKAGFAPLLHFFVFGADEGRDPHFLFSVRHYSASYPDLKLSGINPLLHYLKVGAYQGIDPHPYFDSGFYLEQNPDVREAGLNPLRHYLEAGVAEGRNPNGWFSTSEYLMRHPHVAAYGLNPLVHYVDNDAERLLMFQRRAAGA